MTNIKNISFRTAAEKLIFGVSFFSAAAGLLILGLDSSKRIFFPYALSYAEPVVLAVVQNFPKEPLLYHDYNFPPFILNPYNPLFYWMSVLVGHFSGNGFVCGRALTVFFSFSIVACLYFLLSRHVTGRLNAFLFAALFALTSIVTGYWVEMRPDMTALFFELSGVFLALEGEKKKASGRRLCRLAAVFCFLTAYFTKQTYFMGAVSFFVFLFLKKENRAALFFGLSYLAAGIFLTLALNHLTQGNFWMNQQMTVRKPFIWGLFLRLISVFLKANGPFAAAAFLGAFLAAKHEKLRLFSIYLVLCVLWFFSLGKVGADSNYFLEILAVMTVLACLLFEKIRSAETATFVRIAASAALAAHLVFSLTSIFAYHGQTRRMVTEARVELDKITAVIRQIKGDVLAENMGLLVAAGKPIVYEPFEFTQLANAGVWDDKNITDRLDRRDFPLIVLNINTLVITRTGRFSVNFIRHMNDHYKLFGANKDGWFFYRPRVDI